MAIHASLRIALVAAALLSSATAAAATKSGGTAAPPSPGKAAAPEAAAKAEAPGPQAPQAIPSERVFRAAEDLAPTLTKAESATQVDQVVQDVEERLAAVERERQQWSDLDALRLEDDSARELERLRQALARDTQSLADGLAAIEERMALLVEASQELQRHQASWQLTAEAARGQKAPPAVLQHVAATTEKLRTAEESVRTQQNRLLELGGRVSKLRAEVARAVATVDQAESALKEQIFEAGNSPLWRALAAPSRAGGLGPQLRHALRESRQDVASFLAEGGGLLWIHVAVIVALGLGMLALRRPVAAMEAGDHALLGAVRVLARPWSAALLLSVAVVGWLYPPMPPAVKDVALVAILVPLVRLAPGLVSQPFRRPIIMAAMLFALDKLSALAPPRTALSRLALLLVTVGGLFGLLRGVWRGGWVHSLPRGAWGKATRWAVWAALTLLALSLVANVLGSVALAERLTHATVASATLGALLLGLQTVLEALLAALLHLPSLQSLRLLVNHRRLIQQRIDWALRMGSAALWAWRTAVGFGISATLGSAGGAILALRLKVGGLNISLGNVAAFAVTLGLAVALSRAVRFVLDEGVFPELDLPRGIPATLSKTAQYVILMIGFSGAMLASGLEMSRFSFLVGALGVGIGFGLQNVVNNFVSGLILLFERPIQLGDVIDVSGVSGEVTRIGVRSSTLRTSPGAEIIVPNGTLIANAVTNWTLSDRRRRIDVAVGVAYGTRPQQVIDLLLASVQGRAGVLPSPAPAALLLHFGENAIEFALRFWTGDLDRAQALASEVMIEVLESFDRAGIYIPSPQRDLQIRSLDAAAVKALDASRGGGDGSAPGGEPAAAKVVTSA